MNVNRLIIALLILFSLGMKAQKSFSLDDVVPGGKNFYQYYPRYANGSFFLADDGYVQSVNDSFYVWNQKLERSFLVDAQAIKSILASTGSDKPGLIRNPIWVNASRLWLNRQGGYVLVDWQKKMVCDSVRLLANAQNIDFNALGGVAAFTVDNNLFVSQRGMEPKQISHAESRAHVYGQSVHRNEFGIEKGTFWSPDAAKLAFYFMDESMVDDYPLVDVSTRIASAKPIKYPMAGLESHQVKVGVYDLAGGATVYLNTGSPVDRFFTNICWTPDGKNILVAEINRGQNHMKLDLYDATSGNKLRTLFEETDEHWVEPTNAAVFLKKNPSQFVWQSKRDGYNHLYLYDLNGKMFRQLTKGNWNVTKFYGFDATEKNFYVQTTGEGHLERHIYRVITGNGKISRLTQEPGTHRAVLSPNGNLWVDHFSSLNVAAQSSLVTSKSGTKITLAQTINPYEGFDMPEIRMVDLKTADHAYSLTGRMMLPIGFDPAKKYPVIVYVYGGPHSQMVTNSWLGGASSWMLWAAQRGYIVFTMDNRGTDGHGKAFEQAIHRRLGECEMADQMEGVKYLTSLPFVDGERIGVHGWSYGGFMTTSLMLKHNDVFKVGVCGGPVIDWKLYEIMYGERYMDMPQENPEGYAETNLCNYVKNLKGRLLMIHGDVDPVVVWQHSLLFVKEAVKNRVQVDYFAYPGHEHNVIGPDRVHLIDKVIRYFDDYL